MANVYCMQIVKLKTSWKLELKPRVCSVQENGKKFGPKNRGEAAEMGQKSTMRVKSPNSAAGEIDWLVKGLDAWEWMPCNLPNQLQAREQTPAYIFCIRQISKSVCKSVANWKSAESVRLCLLQNFNQLSTRMTFNPISNISRDSADLFSSYTIVMYFVVGRENGVCPTANVPL